MSKHNATSGIQTGDNGRNPKTGQFSVGNPGGPGRPRGKLDFMAICKRRARATKMDLEDAVWEIFEGMLKAAKDGDTSAAKLLLDRMCGLMEKDGPQLAVQINGTDQQVNIGPPVPDDADLGDFVQRLYDITGEQGLLPEKEDG